MKATTINPALPKSDRSRSEVLARLYLLLIQLMGLTVLVFAIRKTGSEANHLWAYLAVLTAAASLLSTKISRGGTASGSVTISLGDFFVFVAMVTLGPAAAALMGAVEGLVSSLRVKIKDLRKILFNIAQLAISSFLVGSLVSYLLGPEAFRAQTSLSVNFLFLLLFSGLVYFLLNCVLVATAMRLVSGQSLREIGSKGFVWALPTVGVNSSMVVILLSLLAPINFGLALALVPLLLIAYLLTGVKESGEESSLFGANFLPKTLAQKAKAYLFGVALVAVPVYVYCLHQTATNQEWNWLYLAGLAVVASCFPIRLFSISDRIWLTLSDVFVFVALFQFGVEVAVVVASLEAVTFNLRKQARPAYRWVFNLAQIILVAFLVGQFFELLQKGLTQPGFLSMGNVAMLLIAPWLVGFLYYALSSTFTGLAIAWSSRLPLGQVLTQNIRWCAVSVAGSVLAAFTFVLVGNTPW